MKAYVFPGQGAQFPGMGKEIFDNSETGKELFESANEILGFKIPEIMCHGSEEDLKQTRVTQPAIFLHSTILAKTMGEMFHREMVGVRALREVSALVANGTLSFVDGLNLVTKRAMAMQKACETEPSTMAAIIGLEDEIVKDVCSNIGEVVVPANYNSPGQIVISGSIKGIDMAIDELVSCGAKRALKLVVGGAFHSPLMVPAQEELTKAIYQTQFSRPVCPIYQNYSAEPSSNPEKIKENLILQLTSPVRWTQTVINMIRDGASSFIEVGPGKVLQGLIRKIDRNMPTESVVFMSPEDL